MLKANEIEKLIKGKKSLPPTADYFEKFLQRNLRTVSYVA